MKKFSKYLMSAATVTALALSTGAFLKVYAAEAPASVVAGQPVDLTYAAEKALPSVVHIKYVQNSKTKTVEVQDDPWGGFFDPFGFFGNPGGGSRQQRVQTPKREATGSGVIISQDGYIVTNNHVVEGADELTVTLNDNREFSAKIIGTDKQTDLALIKVNAKDLPAITIANSDDLKVGEWVLAVGNPYNLNNTVTAGIVSAKSRGLGASANGIESFIQTDAAINPGNSGGALVNTKVDGKSIVKMSELQEMINAKRPGDKITLTYLRNKKKIEKTITLKNAQGNTKPIEQADIDVLGAQFRPVTKAMMEQLNISYGLEVIKVNSGALKDAGINRGFIIQRVNEGMVKTIDDLQKEVKKASVSKDPVLYIQGMYPTGKKAYFAVPIGE